jgi:RimJ/RimL family protein N-acetyltransferase
MRAYFLTTSRLGFSTWTLNDLPLAARIWEDPDVMRLHGGPFDRVAVTRRLEQEIARSQNHGVQYWPLFSRETGEHVGCCGLKPHDVSQSIWEFGCQICRQFWSRGMGREATEALLRYSFDVLGIRAIRAGHHPANDASRRLITSLRFHPTPNEFYPATGLMEPCYLLTREEYSAK